MAEVEVQAPVDPGLPDYLTNPNAILNDTDVKWRYGQAPDYSKTRKVWEETKQMNHVAGSLPSLVENLVKNWEVEASFKPELKDWRTIDPPNYSFAINGGKPQGAEHMLQVGTYNAIIAANDFYSPETSDFASSHKTFKRMMPTFAWEVLEVYSGPPQVSFRWRHWGTMKNDYVGFNDKGEKITAKAHGGSIDVQGVTVATVDDKVRLQKVETWFDPMEMFRQISPNGVVNRQIVPKKADNESTSSEPTKQEEGQSPPAKAGADNTTELPSRTSSLSESSGWTKVSEQAPSAAAAAGTTAPATEETSTKLTDSAAAAVITAEDGSSKEAIKEQVAQLEASKADGMRPTEAEGVTTTTQAPNDMEKAVQPGPGESVVAPASSEEARKTHEEMSKVTPMECPFLMNQE